jgi:hypothetical protein
MGWEVRLKSDKGGVVAFNLGGTAARWLGLTLVLLTDRAAEAEED